MGAITLPMPARAKKVEGPDGIYSLQIPEKMTVEYKVTAGCRMHIVQENEAVFAAIISSCFDEFLYPTLEKFAEAKLKGINKPDWKETLREKVSLSGVPAIHAQGTYTLTVKNYSLKMLSDLYFIFVGQRGFEVDIFHPTNDLYPYKRMKKDLLAGLKVQRGGQAGQPDEFERVVRKTMKDIQAKKEQTDPNLKGLIDDLKSRDVLVRLKAAKSLGKLGPTAKNAIPVLTEVARQDVDEDVREVASRALENIRVGSSVGSSKAGKDRQTVPKKRTEDVAPKGKIDEAPTITVQAPDGSEVTIIPSDESRRLAQEIGVITREKYYALDADIIGYEARFQIWKDGAALDELICRRDPKSGRTTARLNARESRDSAVWIEQLFVKAFFSILEPTPKGDREYACRSGDSYIMADYDAVNENVQAFLVFFEDNFRVARRVKIYSNGQVQETVWQMEEFGNRFFVRTVTMIARLPNAPERKVIFSFDYRKVDNVVFPYLVNVNDEGAGEKTTYRADLTEVTFDRSETSSRVTPSGEAAEAGRIEPDRETLTLAKEVVGRINESYYSLVATDLQSFHSKYTVTRDNAYVGKLQIRWERDRPRLEISFSGSLEPKFQTWLKNSAEFGFRSTLLIMLPAQAEYQVQAIQTGDGYEVDYSADPSVVVHKTYVAGDFRRLRDFQHYKDGLKIRTEFVVRHAEGKHFVKSLTRQASKPGMQELKNRLIFTYIHRKKYIFLKRLVIEDFTPSVKTIWKLELNQVTLKSNKNK
jgi:hypothetical protein